MEKYNRKRISDTYGRGEERGGRREKRGARREEGEERRKEGGGWEMGGRREDGGGREEAGGMNRRLGGESNWEIGFVSFVRACERRLLLRASERSCVRVRERAIY